MFLIPSSRKKLPSIRSIQKLFQCSTNTVLKAYEKLEQDHIICSVPKISKVNEKQIDKNMPIILDTIQKHLI